MTQTTLHSEFSENCCDVHIERVERSTYGDHKWRENDQHRYRDATENERATPAPTFLPGFALMTTDARVSKREPAKIISFYREVAVVPVVAESQISENKRPPRA